MAWIAMGSGSESQRAFELEQQALALMKPYLKLTSYQAGLYVKV
jgi:hypothetical protein